MFNLHYLPETRFPKEFLWGSSTAGHQIEGDNIHSQRWPMEIEKGIPSGKACNHWELYREDVDLIASLGHQGYRMSVEWSRIEPEMGRWDEGAIAHYVDLLERLKAKGLKVFVTLHHFTHPLWFEKLGGFSKDENLRYFERFVGEIARRISDYVDGWNVINEFNLSGRGPEKLLMIRAHARGYHVLKQYSKAPVSSAHAFVHWSPQRKHDVLDQTATAYNDFVSNEFFFHAIRTGELVYPHLEAVYNAEVKGSLDFWAVNSYTRHMGDARKGNAQSEIMEGPRYPHKSIRGINTPFYLEEFYPEGLTANLERLKDKPVIITENGYACDDDWLRIAYIALHLSALKDAIDRGVDVRGYFYWSTMDNYEWGSFVPRFGLVEVDLKNFKRTPKPSAAFYKEVINGNGFDSNLVRKYLPSLPWSSYPLEQT